MTKGQLGAILMVASILAVIVGIAEPWLSRSVVRSSGIAFGVIMGFVGIMLILGKFKLGGSDAR